jgi:glutathione synthase/RimK-type ligase-like ATP-grasp enzyme
LLKQLQDTFSKRAFVVQPFIENIQSEGEYSLFYFGNKFSHAIQKIPKARDFRVQEEYGAAVVSVEPEPQLLQTAEHVLSLVKPAPVYVRNDFVRGPDGRFLVMELELVEPSMYLRMDSDAPRRFAAAFDNYVRAQSPGDHQ